MAELRFPDIRDPEYVCFLQLWAREIDPRTGKPNSDGCTMAYDASVEACWEHDMHWQLGRTFYGEKIGPFEANARFFSSTRATTKRFGKGWWSLRPYRRWLAVTLNATRKKIVGEPFGKPEEYV